MSGCSKLACYIEQKWVAVEAKSTEVENAWFFDGKEKTELSALQKELELARKMYSKLDGENPLQKFTEEELTFMRSSASDLVGILRSFPYVANALQSDAWLCPPPENAASASFSASSRRQRL